MSEHFEYTYESTHAVMKFAVHGPNVPLTRGEMVPDAVWVHLTLAPREVDAAQVSVYGYKATRDGGPATDRAIRTITFGEHVTEPSPDWITSLVEIALNDARKWAL